MLLFLSIIERSCEQSWSILHPLQSNRGGPTVSETSKSRYELWV